MITITVRSDNSCAMAEILLDGEVVYVGNYWDFHPGCTTMVGRLAFLNDVDWKGRTTMVKLLSSNLRAQGLEVQVVEEKYNYEEELEAYFAAKRS